MIMMITWEAKPFDEPKSELCKIRNLTPHNIDIFTHPDPEADNMCIQEWGDLVCTFDKEPFTARVLEMTDQLGKINGIPMTRKCFGMVTNLPCYEAGVFLIVSRMVAEAAKAQGRTTGDLLVPDDMVRNSEGHILGCRAFAIVE